MKKLIFIVDVMEVGVLIVVIVVKGLALFIVGTIGTIGS